MQIQEISPKKEGINDSELLVHWLEFLDKLYYTFEKVEIDLAEDAFEFLRENSLCMAKLKSVMFKNAENVTVLNADFSDEK